jgi:hypothetical protein
MTMRDQDLIITLVIIILLLSLVYSIEVQIFTLSFAKFVPLIVGIAVTVIAYGYVKIESINWGLLISGIILIITGGLWWFVTGEMYEKIAILFVGLVAVLYIAYKKAENPKPPKPSKNVAASSQKK